ncbi:MAG: hypothetical protein WB987_02805 [Candidatus Acidiferrales bacterium]
MNPRKRIRSYLLACSLVAVWHLPVHGGSLQGSAKPRDGQHDFDFDIGTWKTHLKRLVHPLTGSTTWVELDGATVVRKLWDGRANLAELEADSPAGHLEVLSLRLYNPQSRQWSLNAANSHDGILSVPTVGEFRNGRGEFFDQEEFNGRMILVRNVWSDITPDSCRFEQAFSEDGGKTWEVNWIATDTRIPDAQVPGSHLEDKSGGSAGPIGTPQASHSSSIVHESPDDAWWTGPMLAPSAATLPRGHFLLEPYLYDVTTLGRLDHNGVRRSASRSDGFGSLTYALYGLADKLTVGLIPTAGFNEVSSGPSSSGVDMGDLTLQAQYRLAQFHAGSWIPTMSVAVQETLPTGRYDRLGNRPGDALGSGAYTTTLAFYSQTYFWLPNGRILRMRFNVAPAFSSNVNLEDSSVYGTESGFRGHTRPGNSVLVDASWEYSLTRNWVLALDATYRHEDNTHVSGFNIQAPAGSQNPSSIQLNSGSSEAFGFAPAIEYSWKHNLGVLLGTRVIAAGRNTAATVTPAMAINFVH